MAYKEAIHAGKIQSISWASCLATMYVFKNQYFINNKKIIIYTGFFLIRVHTLLQTYNSKTSQGLSKTPFLNFKDLINYF